MSHIIHDILKLETEINQEKLRLKAAIKGGVVFEEVKKIMQSINDLQRNLEICLAKQ